MRMASTGLGKAKMRGNIVDLKPGGDLLILSITTTEPNGWHLRAALQIQDIPKLIKGFIKPSILIFIIRSILFPKRAPKEPDDF